MTARAYGWRPSIGDKRDKLFAAHAIADLPHLRTCDRCHKLECECRP